MLVVAPVVIEKVGFTCFRVFFAFVKVVLKLLLSIFNPIYDFFPFLIRRLNHVLFAERLTSQNKSVSMILTVVARVGFYPPVTSRHFKVPQDPCEDELLLFDIVSATAFLTLGKPHLILMLDRVGWI